MSRPFSAQPRWRRIVRGWSWLLVLVAGSAAYILVLNTLTVTDNTDFVPSLLLLGSLVVPASVLAFAGTRVRQDTPAAELAMVAIAGGIVGTVAAGTVEYDVLRRLGALPMLAVALIEEAAKLIVPAVVLLISRARARSSGVVIGIASGAGFATLETMGYGLHALLVTGSIAAVDDTLLLRGLLSPAGHVAWTGMAAAALWAIPGARPRSRAVGLAVGVFAVVVVLHAIWDGSDLIGLRVGVAVLSLFGLLVTIVRQGGWTAEAGGGQSVDTTAR